MRKKWIRFLSMSLSLAMILSNNIMPVATYADTNDNEGETVIYADDMAYDKTTGHFYKLSSVVGTYEQVNAEAKESGESSGYLACISSAEENEIVAKVASVERASESSYIGLTRNAENLQEWLWEDGSEVSYTNWQSGEPNSIDETAAEIYNNRRNTGAGKWNDCIVTLNRTGVIEYNSCIHPKSQYIVKNKALNDCEQGGYTGDIYCGFCGEKIVEGEIVESRGHSDAIIDKKTVKEATCTEEGYTGDKICPTCDKVLEQGKSTPANGHTASEELRKVKEASCYVDGYTGETYCTVCGETIEAGDAITKLEHDYVDDVCKNCGRIRDAKKGITYSSQTTEELPIQVIEYTAIENEQILFWCENDNTEYWDSYGFLFDETNYSDEKIAEALENYYSGEKDEIRLKGYLKKDDDSGVENAPAIKYTVQKDKKYYLVIVPYSDEFGKFTVTIGCPHNKTHLENKTIKSCVEGGYTGDIKCNICGKVVEQGENIAPNSEHDYKTIKFVEATCKEYAKRYLRCRNCRDEQVQVDEQKGYAEHRYILVNGKKATCTTDGYLGDSKCKYCGLENEEQPEDKVIKAYHNRKPGTENSYMIENYNQIQPSCEKEGYTGDVYCPICHEIIEKGEPIKKLNHSFKDGKCTNCGADEEVVNSEKDGYYEISTFDELITYLKNSSSGISGKLMNDIEFPESYEDKDNIIGKKEIVNAVFDGNGHKISGINSRGIKRPLVYRILRSEIKNLEIECKNEKYDEDMCCDLAIGAFDSKITNCSVSGNKNVQDSYTAMVMYAQNSNFIECTNNANIIFDGNTYGLAGIVCEADNCVFDRCVNNGNITALMVESIGGIVTVVRNCIIKDCINKGNINSEYNAAGIVAIVYNEDNDPWTTSITGCTNQGKIENTVSDNDYNMAGICAEYRGPNSEADLGELIINDCINNGEIIGESAVGIIGYAAGAGITVNNCTNNGNIIGESAAGIIGYAYGITVNNCTNNGKIIGESAAGIIGYAADITVNNCTNNGNVSADKSAGGIFVYIRFVKGTGLVNNGNISADEYAGGICAYDEGGSAFSKLYNTGIIDGNNMDTQVTNLVKLGENSTIEDSEEQHVHEFNTEVGAVKATTENNGYFEYVCKCDNTNRKEISKINSVSLSAEKYSYTGNSITLPTVTVKDADDKTISSEYYTVAYRNKATGTVVTKIKDEGIYEAVVTFNTLYDGEVVKEFTIVKERNPSDNNGTDNATTSDKGNDAKITKPGKVTRVSAKVNKKKRITIKWKKQKKAKGYQVRYALNKKMKKAKIKTIKNIKKAYVLKKVKAGKYYIQVRAYTVVNGKKVFGKWSSKKVVKVRK